MNAQQLFDGVRTAEFSTNDTPWTTSKDVERKKAWARWQLYKKRFRDRTLLIPMDLETGLRDGAFFSFGTLTDDYLWYLNSKFFRCLAYNSYVHASKVNCLDDTAQSIIQFIQDNPIEQQCPVPTNIVRIVVDPGHGDTPDKYLDPGAVWTDPGSKRPQLLEKDIALRVSLSIQQALQRAEYGCYVRDVLLTRTGDLVHSEELPKLKWRTDFAIAKKAHIFVSIHLDSATASSTGHTVYYSAQDSSGMGKILAEAVSRFYRIVPPKSSGSVQTKDLHVTRELSNTVVKAAILIELGYISNIAEATTLVDVAPEIGDQIAAGIFQFVNDNYDAIATVK